MMTRAHSKTEWDSSAGLVEVHLWALYPGTEQESEEQLVPLEEGAADIAVEGVCEVAMDGLETLRHCAVLLCGGDRSLKEGDEPGKGVLVHGIDDRKVRDGKEEDCRVVAAWLVCPVQSMPESQHHCRLSSVQRLREQPVAFWLIW